MSFNLDELSTDKARPIECYAFFYKGQIYSYTSSQYPITLNINDYNYVFNPEYIKRGDSLKLGDSGGNVETCTITVLRTNSVALLYQGAPPEFDAIKIIILRVHGDDNNDYSQVLYGAVSQVTFRDSEAELIITIENILDRYVPRGSLSYFCQNSIYDSKCRLVESNWETVCYGRLDGLWLTSTNLLEKPSGYFTDGFMRMGSCYRAIKLHTGNRALLKYPVPPAEVTSPFYVYPGCNGLFKECAEKFNNTDNFSGVPYIEPYNPFVHATGKGVYWVDGNIVKRDTNCKIYNMNL